MTFGLLFIRIPARQTPPPLGGMPGAAAIADPRWATAASALKRTNSSIHQSNELSKICHLTYRSGGSRLEFMTRSGYLELFGRTTAFVNKVLED